MFKVCMLMSRSCLRHVQQQSGSARIQSGTSGLMTETTSPEQSPYRSLRGVTHTFYTTQTNEASLLHARTGPPARFKLPQVKVASTQV